MTAKHNLLTSVNKEVSQKVADFFECNKCDYRTSKQSNYNKHIMTAKHLSITPATKSSEYILACECCNKKYNSRVGLWAHKKKSCSNNMIQPCYEERSAEKENITRHDNFNVDFIIEMMKENQEFKSLIMEQQKENKELVNKMVEITQNQLVVPNTINNNTTNNNNQKFNLNFFLNETCKDAMNIQEFIENIKITFEDLLTVGNVGFVNGITDIFMKQLRDMDVEKRPIHCTDSKREIIYLKANNRWNKDDKENKQLKDAIEKVEYKNVASLHQWCAENPDSKINNTPNNLLRDKIFLQTLQGDDKTRDKIIKNISKEIVIDK